MSTAYTREQFLADQAKAKADSAPASTQHTLTREEFLGQTQKSGAPFAGGARPEVDPNAPPTPGQDAITPLAIPVDPVDAGILAASLGAGSYLDSQPKHDFTAGEAASRAVGGTVAGGAAAAVMPRVLQGIGSVIPGSLGTAIKNAGTAMSIIPVSSRIGGGAVGGALGQSGEMVSEAVGGSKLATLAAGVAGNALGGITSNLVGKSAASLARIASSATRGNPSGMAAGIAQLASKDPEIASSAAQKIKELAVGPESPDYLRQLGMLKANETATHAALVGADETLQVPIAGKPATFVSSQLYDRLGSQVASKLRDPNVQRFSDSAQVQPVKNLLKEYVARGKIDQSEADSVLQKIRLDQPTGKPVAASALLDDNGRPIPGRQAAPAYSGKYATDVEDVIRNWGTDFGSNPVLGKKAIPAAVSGELKTALKAGWDNWLGKNGLDGAAQAPRSAYALEQQAVAKDNLTQLLSKPEGLKPYEANRYISNLSKTALGEEQVPQILGYVKEAMANTDPKNLKGMWDTWQPMLKKHNILSYEDTDHLGKVVDSIDSVYREGANSSRIMKAVQTITGGPADHLKKTWNQELQAASERAVATGAAKGGVFGAQQAGGQMAGGAARAIAEAKQRKEEADVQKVLQGLPY